MNSIYNNFKSLCTELQQDCLTITQYAQQERTSEQDHRVALLAIVKLTTVSTAILGGAIAFTATAALLNGALITTAALTTLAALCIICGHDGFKVAQNLQDPVTTAIARARGTLIIASTANIAAGLVTRVPSSIIARLRNFGLGSGNSSSLNLTQEGVRTSYEGYARVITQGTWIPSLWTDLYAKIGPWLDNQD